MRMTAKHFTNARNAEKYLEAGLCTTKRKTEMGQISIVRIARLNLTDWSKILGIADSTLQRRLSSGWSIEDAFTRPIQQHRKMDGDGNG